MIYTDWQSVIGKTIKKVEHYNKEFTSKNQYNKYVTSYMSKEWDVLFFEDGVLIQEFTDVYYEDSSINFIDSIDEIEPPAPEVIDIIQKYK